MCATTDIEIKVHTESEFKILLSVTKFKANPGSTRKYT